MADSTETTAPFTVQERWSIGIAGFILILLGCALGKKETVGETLVLVGSLGVLLGMNGLRFTKLTAGKFTLDTPGSVTAARNSSASIAKAVAAPEEVPIVEVASASLGDGTPPAAVLSRPATEALAPTAQPRGTVRIGNTDWPVYDLDAVPLKVLAAPFADWQAGFGTMPSTTRQFEFAVRLGAGKGNHPWVLKFQGSVCLKVTAGGQGQVGAMYVNAIGI